MNIVYDNTEGLVLFSPSVTLNLSSNTRYDLLSGLYIIISSIVNRLIPYTVLFFSYKSWSPFAASVIILFTYLCFRFIPGSHPRPCKSFQNIRIFTMFSRLFFEPYLRGFFFHLLRRINKYLKKSTHQNLLRF